MKIIGIIPARHGSKRLLAKPLIQLNNKPLIQLTHEAVLSSQLFDQIFIATDSLHIKHTADKFGANCIMTSKSVRNGTERCAELIKKLNNELDDQDIIVNIQCDEPFIKKNHLLKVIELLQKHAQITTLISPIKNSELYDDSVVKANTSKENVAMNFSRKIETLKKSMQTYKHIGIYGYRKNTLLEISNLSPTKREVLENLEQLRWLENNYKISCDFISENLISINTKEDIKKVSKKAP